MVEGLGFVFADTGAATPPSLRQKILRSVVNWLYARAFSLCRQVIFLNTDDREHFISSGALPSGKGIVLGGIGVDLEQLPQVPVTTQPVTFLLMARLLREKGICQYAEAARIVKAEHPQTRFVLLGGLDPNPGGLSEEEILSWVSEGILEWPGHINDVRPWLQQCSVFVLPSYYREGVPRSIQEAMAMGRPIITTDNVGCRETVEEGVNGFLVPVRDHHKLAEAMLRFVQTPDIIAPMGQASRLAAEKRYDVHKVNGRLLRSVEID
jgi:glycosyltransferase involved in cell wall biosynthesis